MKNKILAAAALLLLTACSAPTGPNTSPVVRNPSVNIETVTVGNVPCVVFSSGQASDISCDFSELTSEQTLTEEKKNIKGGHLQLITTEKNQTCVLLEMKSQKALDCFFG